MAQLLYDGFLQVLQAMRTLCFCACQLLATHEPSAVEARPMPASGALFVRCMRILHMPAGTTAAVRPLVYICCSCDVADLHTPTHALVATQLDFGFTAYATNCYLKCSPRAALLQRGALPYPRGLSTGWLQPCLVQCVHTAAVRSRRPEGGVAGGHGAAPLDTGSQLRRRRKGNAGPGCLAKAQARKGEPGRCSSAGAARWRRGRAELRR